MYYVCHNTHILVKGKMKKDEKNEEKKRMNPWFYAIFWLSRQKLALGWETDNSVDYCEA